MFSACIVGNPSRLISFSEASGILGDRNAEFDSLGNSDKTSYVYTIIGSEMWKDDFSY